MTAHTVSGGTGSVRGHWQAGVLQEEPSKGLQGPGKAAAWDPALGKGPVGFNTLLLPS